MVDFTIIDQWRLDLSYSFFFWKFENWWLSEWQGRRRPDTEHCLPQKAALQSWAYRWDLLIFLFYYFDCCCWFNGKIVWKKSEKTAKSKAAHSFFFSCRLRCFIFFFFFWRFFKSTIFSQLYFLPFSSNVFTNIAFSNIKSKIQNFGSVKVLTAEAIAKKCSLLKRHFKVKF